MNELVRRIMDQLTHKPVIELGARFAALVLRENAVLEIGFPNCRTAQDSGGLKRDLLASQHAANLYVARKSFDLVQVKIHTKSRLHFGDELDHGERVPFANRRLVQITGGSGGWQLKELDQ